MATVTKHNAATLLLSAHMVVATEHPTRAIALGKRIACAIRGDLGQHSDLKTLSALAVAFASQVVPFTRPEECAIMVLALVTGVPVSDPHGLITVDIINILDEMYQETDPAVFAQYVAQVTDLVRATR